MKISDDQNTITFADGTVLVAEPRPDSDFSCNGCYFVTRLSCYGIPCGNWERKSSDNVIFVQKV